MQGEGDEGYEVADWRHDGDASLAEFHVDAGVGECGDGVACEGGEEDERDDGVAEVIVCFEL